MAGSTFRAPPVQTSFGQVLPDGGIRVSPEWIDWLNRLAGSGGPSEISHNNLANLQGGSVLGLFPRDGDNMYHLTFPQAQGLLRAQDSSSTFALPVGPGIALTSSTLTSVGTVSLLSGRVYLIAGAMQFICSGNPSISVLLSDSSIQAIRNLQAYSALAGGNLTITVPIGPFWFRPFGTNPSITHYAQANFTGGAISAQGLITHIVLG